ncbi:MAG: cupin domain-containing protein [Saccharofermentanales bacterium]|jgi:dTDP-4-dehydrorhamnose 3,5-epimerase-like enzyme
MKLIEFLQPDFIFENAEGSLKQLVHDGWKQVNIISSLGGSKRGGHYHKYNKEAFYVIIGSFQLIVWHADQRQEYIIKTGDFFLINEDVFHTFEYIEDTWLISMYSNGVEMDDKEKDIWTE